MSRGAKQRLRRRKRLRKTKAKQTDTLDTDCISHPIQSQDSSLSLLPSNNFRDHPPRDSKSDLEHKSIHQGHRRRRLVNRPRVHIHYCDVKGCNNISWDMRGHVMEKHLPNVLGERYLADRSFQHRRMKLLHFLNCKIVGRDRPFEDLLGWVNSKKAISQDIYVQEADIDWLTRICRGQRWEVPDQFTLVPVNSVALLFHWRVLPLLLNELTEEERIAFKHEKVTWEGMIEEDVMVVDKREKTVKMREVKVVDKQEKVRQAVNMGEVKTVAKREVSQTVKMEEDKAVDQPEKVIQVVDMDEDVMVVDKPEVSQTLKMEEDVIVVDKAEVSQTVKMEEDVIVVDKPEVSQTVQIREVGKAVDKREKVSQTVKMEEEVNAVDNHTNYVRHTVKIEKDVVVVGLQEVSQSVKMKENINDVSRYEAFDSYFHFDRLSQSLSGNILEALSDIISIDVGCQPRTNVSLIGGIVVFSDPESFPESLPSIRGFGSAIGVHPRKCHLLTKERFQTILHFLTTYDIVALGDIGLDWTEPESSWELQQCTMTRLLQFSMPVRPVILHMRENQDQHARKVSARCLQIMKANVAPTQKIHLHSFSGTVDQVVSWLKAFPNCFFSFSENVSSFDHYQIAALKRVPGNRLLLESDSPGFKSVTAKVTTPAFLGDIGEVVAKHRRRSLTKIMHLTTMNGRQLYSL